MYDAWNAATGGDVGVLGSGSDYTAFVHNGIASVSRGTYRLCNKRSFES